eukprot:GHVT01015534.1.p1 GENE.GHVT01015534.1~~GHVT01015534.1.p1  ORF type:complete len:1012 (-),score=64.20 GHVT01015534.1:1143-4178(-)
MNTCHCFVKYVRYWLKALNYRMGDETLRDAPPRQFCSTPVLSGGQDTPHTSSLDLERSSSFVSYVSHSAVAPSFSLTIALPQPISSPSSADRISTTSRYPEASMTPPQVERFDCGTSLHKARPQSPPDSVQKKDNGGHQKHNSGLIPEIVGALVHHVAYPSPRSSEHPFLQAAAQIVSGDSLTFPGRQPMHHTNSYRMTSPNPEGNTFNGLPHLRTRSHPSLSTHESPTSCLLSGKSSVPHDGGCSSAQLSEAFPFFTPEHRKTESLISRVDVASQAVTSNEQKLHKTPDPDLFANENLPVVPNSSQNARCRQDALTGRVKSPIKREEGDTSSVSGRSHNISEADTEKVSGTTRTLVNSDISIATPRPDEEALRRSARPISASQHELPSLSSIPDSSANAHLNRKETMGATPTWCRKSFCPLSVIVGLASTLQEGVHHHHPRSVAPCPVCTLPAFDVHHYHSGNVTDCAISTMPVVDLPTEKPRETNNRGSLSPSWEHSEDRTLRMKNRPKCDSLPVCCCGTGNMRLPMELVRYLLVNFLEVTDVFHFSMTCRRTLTVATADNWVKRCILQGGVSGNVRSRLWSHLAGCGPALEFAVAHEVIWMAQQDSFKTSFPVPFSLDDHNEKCDALQQSLFSYLSNSCCVETSRREEILRDVSRTFPKHALFCGDHPHGKKWLYAVLHALICLHPTIGYCQGMNFLVAGLLIQVLDPCAAFWITVAIMRHFDYALMFAPGVPLVPVRLAQFSEVVRHFLPSLWEHLQRNSVKVDFFANQWFMTVFAYCLEPTLLGFVWDAFLASGWNALFRVGLALLESMETKILNLGVEGIVRVAQDSKCISANGDVAECRRFLRRASAIRLSNATLRALASNFAVMKFLTFLKTMEEPLDENDSKHEVVGRMRTCESPAHNLSTSWNAGTGLGGGGEPLKGVVLWEERWVLVDMISLVTREAPFEGVPYLTQGRRRSVCDRLRQQTNSDPGHSSAVSAPFILSLPPRRKPELYRDNEEAKLEKVS